ncbi:hypothetical protein CLIB1423_02S05380 [[Candida] railenensis]|uniref:Sphingoid long-chain base transporter RSB1 n=1 Tax=[Candida] railenensis TaxID=45579 RepID=A0A9P0QKG7_9ASCO|nr:hypothetical protein CLIB1423_02S05380 [[Candida] railenensis]
MSTSDFTLPIWHPSSIPSNVIFSTVAPSKTSTLDSLITKAMESLRTETASDGIKGLAYEIYGAQASKSIASAAEVTATATDVSVLNNAREVILNSTLFLELKFDDDNMYSYDLKLAPNVLFTTIFASITLYTILMIWKSRYHWYNVAMIGGFGLEFAGFLGRTLSVQNETVEDYWLMQTICLTIAPAFLMGGIYFLFAQLVIVHGRQYSFLKPMWYSYFFIVCDVLSLVVQSIGGGQASVASQNHTDSDPGTYTMLAGIAFQILSMGIFLIFFFEALWRIYFRHDNIVAHQPLQNKTILNFFRFLFNTRSSREFRLSYLEADYNPKFADIRQRQLFQWFPLVIATSSLLIYIRCIYRVVEFGTGYNSWLFTREWPIMVLDASLIGVVALIFFPFHPLWVFGSENKIKLSTIKKNLDESVPSPSNSTIDEKV